MTLAVALSLALPACGLVQQTPGVPPGFFGGVVADEPRAALAGRDTPRCSRAAAPPTRR
jgi:hypothetical protein